MVRQNQPKCVCLIIYSSETSNRCWSDLRNDIKDVMEGEVIPEAARGGWALSAWDSPQTSVLQKQIFSFSWNQFPCNIFINAAGGTGSTM